MGDASSGSCQGAPEVYWRGREGAGRSHSGSITCRVVVQGPQFLRQHEFHFIEDPVVGGPQAPDAGG